MRYGVDVAIGPCGSRITPSELGYGAVDPQRQLRAEIRIDRFEDLPFSHRTAFLRLTTTAGGGRRSSRLILWQRSAAVSAWMTTAGKSTGVKAP